MTPRQNKKNEIKNKKQIKKKEKVLVYGHFACNENLSRFELGGGEEKKKKEKERGDRIYWLRQIKKNDPRWG